MQGSVICQRCKGYRRIQRTRDWRLRLHGRGGGTVQQLGLRGRIAEGLGRSTFRGSRVEAPFTRERPRRTPTDAQNV